MSTPSSTVPASNTGSTAPAVASADFVHVSADGSASSGKSSPKTDAPAKASSKLEAGSNTFALKAQLAQMLKGGVIMDVTTAEEARIAEQAGACAVMALERVPSQIRKDGGVARMSHPNMIRSIQAAVSIPVMAKCRIGHFVEAQVLQSLEVDYVDESEVLTLADEQYHIDKHAFSVPFVCGCRNLGEALRRIAEGAAMIRTKGEAGTGNVVEAVRHARAVKQELRKVLSTEEPEELRAIAREHGVALELLQRVKAAGRLPVVQFAAGGIATPADAALLMSLGMDGVFVGSGIFQSTSPLSMAKAIVQATTHWNDPAKVAEACASVQGEPIRGTIIDPTKMEMYSQREKV